MFLRLFIIAGLCFSFQWKKDADLNYIAIVCDYYSSHYSSFPQQEKLVYVSLKQQRCFIIQNNTLQNHYPISSSLFGIGNELNSQKTPLGLHRIVEKLGDGAPLGALIDKNGYTGQQVKILQEAKPTYQDFVTTRALRLDGLEKGINKGGKVDSYLREIYIHGTHEERLIGTPASHGCIRMKNQDIIEVFDQLNQGDYVLILNN